MRREKRVGALAALVLMLNTAAHASGHGPVFAMATPTNAKGGWSVDWGVMGRVGDQNSGAMGRAMFTYGITEDVQVSFSAPAVFSSAALAPARLTSMMPGTADFEGIGAWRFHRQGTGVGRRFETTAYGGIVVPGSQRPAGMMGELRRTPGVYTALATGMASRSHYFWLGAGNVWFAERDGDRRPDVLSYSFVWGYRPPPWQKDYPHWDWRFFAELTGENAGRIRQAGHAMLGTGGHQIFVGPTVLGIYKNYAIQGGIQFPVFHDVGARHERERFRFAINLSYFF